MIKAREEKWFKYMNLLRRHMVKCVDCKGAMAAGSTHRMCLTGMRLTVSAAHEFDAILDVKRQAHKNPDGFVYACPDVSLHGQAYALAAQPLKVTAIQEGLF